MNKLELKHLAPYLPYGLKVKHDFEKVRENRKEPLKDWVKELEPSMLNYLHRKEYKLFHFKPILRPLSDLNLNKFKHELVDVEYIIDNEIHSDLSYDEWCFLFENNFDVFSLIEKELAVDINTLNNE